MRTLIAALMLVLLAQGTASAAAAPSFQELEESLTCQCGCGLTVHACNHLQCPSAIPLREEIRAEMAKGLDRDAILAHFEVKYGEKILSSPTARGFNLAAWVTPFILLTLGAAFVTVTLRRWRRASAAPSSPPEGPRGLAPAPPTDLERQLERELRDFDA
ncbi:MAG: cytochrome c-type biogenesis protein CcmH [Candidatus Binatia bacterium]